MSFKRPLSISPIEKQDEKETCRVCGDKARIVNYGALSCASCKTFFRRHGFHAKIALTCVMNGNCPITKETRKMCTACRFQKCLSVGMCRELIRKEDLCVKSKTQKRTKCEASQLNVFNSKLPALNLLNDDRSSLTTSNWTLLSNVVHAFDIFSPISEVKRYIDLLNMSPDYGPHETKTLLIKFNHCLQSSISATPDFRIMTSGEQCSLIQRNMNGLRSYYAIFIANNSNLFAQTRYGNPMIPVYGQDNIRKMKEISLRLDHDATLIKLMLIVLTFSSNCFVVDQQHEWERDNLLIGTFRLFGSQNAYMEVLWKYMVYRYGYFEAAMRFFQLVNIVLEAIKVSSDIYINNRFHHDLANKMATDTKKSLVVVGNDNVPLWGKR